MKIKIEKPKESIWKFPCFGIHEKTSKIVAFMDDKKGVIVEKGYGVLPLGTYFEDWEMIQFKPYTPTETKPKPIDWDKAELPIWFTHRSGSVNIISQKGNSGLAGTELCEDGGMIWASQYDNVKERNEFLNSLKILPKGTKITFEL